MRRILFVDDEENILRGLRRMLHGMRGEWEMEFAISGEKGLALMEEKPYDVVVSDMRMPAMDGAEFLTQVRARYPATVRIILSGQSDHEKIMRSVGPTHQFLAKPCDADTLKNVVTSILNLTEMLESERLKALVAEIESLPSLPTLFLEVSEELQKSDVSFEAIAAIIEKDVSMSVEIMKLVNSAFFGLMRPANDLKRALHFLGVDTVRGLVLGAGIFRQHEGPEVEGFSMGEVWMHSLRTAAFCRMIARRAGLDEHVASEAYLGGMLHDIGRVVLAVNQSTKYGLTLARSKSGETGLIEAEREDFGVSHAEIGAYLLGLWGFPFGIVRAVAYHHSPAERGDEDMTALSVVHVADAIAAGGPSVEDLLDLDYCRSVGIDSDRIAEWTEAGRELEGEQADDAAA